MYSILSYFLFANYCIAQLIPLTPAPGPVFFYAGLFSKAFLRLKYVPQQEKAMQAIHASEPIPTDPVPIPEPVPQPQPIPEPEPPHDPDVPPISDPPPHQ